jgi:hypothetical protein
MRIALITPEHSGYGPPFGIGRQVNKIRTCLPQVIARDKLAELITELGLRREPSA